MTAAPIRLAIADDHKMFVEAIRFILDTTEAIEVVSVAEDGHRLLQDLARHRPDVALVDISMEGPGFIGIAQAAPPQTRLLALTMHLDHDLADRVLAAGFAGYLVKDAAVAELISAVEVTAAGGRFLSAALGRTGAAPRSPPRGVTAREIACLQAASDGKSNREIGEALGISERTVKFHFENAFRKLEAKSRGQAVAVARRLKLF